LSSRCRSGCGWCTGLDAVGDAGPDALIARGLLSAKRIPLTDITAAGISSNSRGTWAPLIVTAQRRRHVIMRSKRTSTRGRTGASKPTAVDAIRAAAALPRS